MAYQNGTFNTIGGHSAEIGGNLVVWVRTYRVEHFGGNLDVSLYQPGDVIPAGSMAIFDQQANTVEIVKADAAADKLAKGKRTYLQRHLHTLQSNSRHGRNRDFRQNLRRSRRSRRYPTLRGSKPPHDFVHTRGQRIHRFRRNRSIINN